MSTTTDATARRQDATLDEALLTDCVDAWIATHAWISRRLKVTGDKGKCPILPADELLRLSGITWSDRPLYLAYDREIRRRAYEEMGIDRDAPMNCKRRPKDDRAKVMAMFRDGMPRKKIAVEVGASYGWVAQVIRRAEEAA